MHWKHKLLFGGGDCLLDERGLGPLVQHSLVVLDIVLPVCFSDLVLGRAVGRYARSGRS